MNFGNTAAYGAGARAEMKAIQDAINHALVFIEWQGRMLSKGLSVVAESWICETEYRLDDE